MISCSVVQFIPIFALFFVFYILLFDLNSPISPIKFTKGCQKDCKFLYTDKQNDISDMLQKLIFLFLPSFQGVEILSVELSFREGAPILLDRTSLPQTVTFDLEIEANPFGAGVEGTDLWQVEAYILNEDDFGSNNHQPPASSLVSSTTT